MRKIKIDTLAWSLVDADTGETIYQEHFDGEINLRDVCQDRQRWENSSALFTIYDFCRECLGLSGFIILGPVHSDPLEEFSLLLREAEKNLDDLKANLNRFKQTVENLKKY